MAVNAVLLDACTYALQIRPHARSKPLRSNSCDFNAGSRLYGRYGFLSGGLSWYHSDKVSPLGGRSASKVFHLNVFAKKRVTGLQVQRPRVTRTLKKDSSAESTDSYSPLGTAEGISADPVADQFYNSYYSSGMAVMALAPREEDGWDSGPVNQAVAERPAVLTSRKVKVEDGCNGQDPPQSDPNLVYSSERPTGLQTELTSAGMQQISENHKENARFPGRSDSELRVQAESALNDLDYMILKKPRGATGAPWTENQDEEVDIVEDVEYWEGDPEPMTAEEELAILAEMEAEIARLEAEHDRKVVGSMVDEVRYQSQDEDEDEDEDEYEDGDDADCIQAVEDVVDINVRSDSDPETDEGANSEGWWNAVRESSNAHNLESRNNVQSTFDTTNGVLKARVKDETEKAESDLEEEYDTEEAAVGKDEDDDADDSGAESLARAWRARIVSRSYEDDAEEEIWDDDSSTSAEQRRLQLLKWEKQHWGDTNWDGVEDDEDEEEFVEVWEGDMPEPTEEEEAELVRQGEAEIARLEAARQLKAGAREGVADGEAASGSTVARLERQVAEMRAKVLEMEAELAKIKASQGSDAGGARGGAQLEEVDKPSARGMLGFPSNSAQGIELGLARGGESVDALIVVDESEEYAEFEELNDREGGRSGRMQDGESGKPGGASKDETHVSDSDWSDDEDLEEEYEEEDSGKDKTWQEMKAEFSHLKRKEKAQARAEQWMFKDEDEDGDGDGEEKKRGLPAIMRCFDTAKIYAKAGDGGDGVVAFRREKHVPFGGPSGGNAGRGGDVYLVADKTLNSLLPFRRSVHFRAGRGAHGQGSNCHGIAGKDMEIAVPPGTLVKEATPDGEGKVLLELVKPGQRELLLPGGRGGRGNAAFKTAKNRAPQMAENGEKGPEMWLQLELKLVADVGIIGVPNAGKSTLLSVISAAKPKVANYPFTTLVPNLGVVDLDFESLVFADVPGLLEGAHLGVGLGQEFLRHTERCRALVHIIDGTRPQPEYDYEAICNELVLFNPELADKPQVVVYNKMDVPESVEKWAEFQAAMAKRGIQPMAMSAATGEGTQEVVRAARALLASVPKPYDWDNMDIGGEASEKTETKPSVGDLIRARRKAGLVDFSIKVDRHTRTFEVLGEGILTFTQMTNWEYFEAVKRYQHVLEASGINQALLRKGVRDGDTVVIGEMAFDWRGNEDVNSLGDWERGKRGTKVWPH